MDKQRSPFEQERMHFQPEVPVALKNLTHITIFEEKTTPPPDSIAQLFPKTHAQSLCRFVEGKKNEPIPLKVGVVLSGGQAAGGHNVITGLFDALQQLHPQSQLFGFLGGPAGIVDGKYKELLAPYLAAYRNTGGFDMIGSGRTKIETPEQLASSLKTCKTLGLDGLVIIGGDDSNTNAALLAEYFLHEGCKTSVIGAPKTIDGDVKGSFIECSFGFDTACKIYSEMIGNICRDALSAKKYTHFIKLMGRSASHIALECALQTHPNICFIGEEIAAKEMTLKQLIEDLVSCIVKRAELGKNFGVVLLPEGLIEFIPEMRKLIQELNMLLAKNITKPEESLSREAASAFSYLPKEIREQLLLDRDPHGNVQVSHIATDQLLIHLVKDALKNRPDFKGKFSPVGHFFGYEGRCGFPSNFDANYCYALGRTAAALIANRKTGYMSVLQKLTDAPEHWSPLGIPITSLMNIEERKGKHKPVIKKALVDLQGEPFKYFAKHRQGWTDEDDYLFPGPIQFSGPAHLCNATTCTLQLERAHAASNR